MKSHMWHITLEIIMFPFINQHMCPKKVWHQFVKQHHDYSSLNNTYYNLLVSPHIIYLMHSYFMKQVGV
jgi:hypothetical protein